LTKDGNVDAWGWNVYSQLGIVGLGSVPEKISFPYSEIASIICLGVSSMVVTKEGNVWSWGHNEFGTLGMDRGVSSRNISSVLPQFSASVFSSDLCWKRIACWLFLGRSSTESILFKLPLEVIFV